jgi:hypothetical protein
MLLLMMFLSVYRVDHKESDLNDYMKFGRVK